MDIKQEDIHRILITKIESIVVNMVYAEIGDDVFGSFSGGCGGGGFFHQIDGGIVVSDDYGEFNTSFSYENLEDIFKYLDQLRAKFEKYDDEGNMLGCSEEGKKFSDIGNMRDDGLTYTFSKLASEDYIYDCQDEWNLNFYYH